MTGVPPIKAKVCYTGKIEVGRYGCKERRKCSVSTFIAQKSSMKAGTGKAN